MLSTEKTAAAMTMAQGKSASELRSMRDHYRYANAAALGLSVGEKNAITTQLTELLTVAEREAGVAVPQAGAARPWNPKYIGGFFADPGNFAML